MIHGSAPKLKNRKEISLQIDKFNGGVNTLFSETRLKPNEAKEATNLILDEDGIWRKRWGTRQYGGVSFTNTIDGFSEYRKTDGTRELIVVADGKVYKVDPSAETKTEINGATFTQGIRCDFLQINDLLYIVNGTDNMARYDGSTLATYSSISTPTWDGTPLTRGAGLSAGSYTYYYRVSAVNDVGETVAAAEKSITVDIDRDEWSADDEYIQLDWGDVSGANKYIIYFSDTAGYETKLAEVNVSTFQDDGSLSPNPYVEPPLSSTATGPKFKSITVSGNRIWGTGDPNNEQRVYYSGTGANLGNFAAGYGGGWVDLERGGRNQCVAVTDYQGDAHVFCKTDDGKGSIWKIELDSLTLNGETVTIPVPDKLIGKVGTPAQRSVVQVENDVLFFNPSGIFALGFEQNILNVLRANELSSKIRPYITSLYEPDIDKACAYYYQSKVFFSVATASGEPNRIIVYDREHKAWIKDWSVGVSQFGEFTDSNGTTHFLGINGNKLVEIGENIEGDQGVAFTWRYVSPRFPVADNWAQFAKVKRAYARMRGVRGTINFSFNGTDRSGNTTTLQSDTIEQGSSDTGIGWDAVGSFRLGTTSGAPTLYASESLIRYLTISKLLRDVQWDISGDALTDTGVITGIGLKGKLVRVSEPEVWRLD